MMIWPESPSCGFDHLEGEDPAAQIRWICAGDTLTVGTNDQAQGRKSTAVDGPRHARDQAATLSTTCPVGAIIGWACPATGVAAWRHLR